eukprot:9075034-Pyramimonas_sp.AAC.1
MGDQCACQRTSETDEHICHHLGCLSVSVGTGQFRMLYRTELFNMFILIRSGIAVLILGASHSTVPACVLFEFTLTKGILNAFGSLVNSVLCTGHSNVINMLGREQVVARLELLVVRRRSEAESSG